MEEQEHGPAEGQTEPELLYHYTTEKGLYGILDSDCIWATHYCFLNDSEERQFGIKLYESAIYQAALKHLEANESANTLVEYFRTSLSGVLDAYIVCFCTSFPKEDHKENRLEDGRGGDRLSQWRGYAAGSQGYCLAFDFQLLRQIQQITENRNRCYDSFCTYSEDSIRGMIETHVAEVFQSTIASLASNDLANIDSLRNALKQDRGKCKEMNEFVSDALLQCGVFKHAGFQEENEYRLIKLMFRTRPNHDEVHFRNGLFGNTPYIKIPLALASKDSPLKAIIVGPSPNRDQNALSLQVRLRQMRLLDVEAVPSKIPYRSW